VSTINTKLLRWHGLPILLLAALILVTLTPEPALAADEKYTGGSGDGFSVLTSSDIHLYGNPAPTVTSVSPTKGTTADSDLVLTINGTNFVSGGGLAAEINYNGANAIAGSSVTWVSSNQITAHFNLSGVTTNLGSAWDVKVTNPDSQTGTGADLFTIYRPNPTVGSITPNSGVNTGAVNITNLAGTNFVTGQTSVKLQKAGQSDISGTAVTVVSPTQITCTFDLTGAATGTWNVVVTVNGAESAATLTNGFTVTAPGPTVTIPTPIPTKPRASTIPPQFKPAQMSVRYLSVSPQQTYAGQPVTITTNVVNTGDEAGNYNVALKINGQVEQTKMVSVGPQGTQPVKFTVTKAEPGTYTVNISDQRGSFTVTNVAGKPSTGIAAGLLLAVAMAVIVMLVGLLIIIARKRFQSY